MTPTQKAAMQAALDEIHPARFELRQKLVDALAEPAPEPTACIHCGETEGKHYVGRCGHIMGETHFTAPVCEPVPLLTVDEKLKIALACNMRVRIGSGAIKFATAIEELVRQKAGLK